jgi:hypothetical protein
MVAEIMGAFPQISFDQIINEMDRNMVIAWFHMARYSKHGISLPVLFKPTKKFKNEGANIRETHYRDAVKGWVKK